MSINVKPKPKAVLIGQIKNAAKKLAIAAPSISTGQGKTYEAWVMLEIAAGLKAKNGFEVEPRDHKDQPTATFRFRGGPGYIRPSSSAKVDEPCHFLIQCPMEREWELHASVQHRGASNDEHELDICIVDGPSADQARALPQGTAFQGRRLLALELKEYDVESHLDKGISRALLGIAVDLDPGIVVAGFNLRTAIGNQVTYVGQRQPPEYGLITTAQIREASEKFLQAYGITATSGVTPLDAVAIDRIVERLFWRLWLSHP